MKSTEEKYFLDENLRFNGSYCHYSINRLFNGDDLKCAFSDDFLIEICNDEYLLGLKFKHLKKKAYVDIFFIEKANKFIFHKFIDKLVSFNHPCYLKDLKFVINEAGLNISFKKENDKIRFLGSFKGERKEDYFHFDFFINKEIESSIESGYGERSDFLFTNRIIYSNAVGYVSINNFVYNFSSDSRIYVDLEKYNKYKNNFITSGVGFRNENEDVSFFMQHNHRYNAIQDDNVVSYKGIQSKLSRVRFYLALSKKGNDSLESDWLIKSAKDDANLVFKPLGIFKLEKRKMFKKKVDYFAFGYYSGKVVIEGKEVEIAKILGLARKKVNR